MSPTQRFKFSFLPWVLCLLLGCDGDGKLPSGDDSGGTNSEPTDADGDGYTTTTDCDDLDAAIHPDAIETCNEVDDNCDGSRDEGVTSTFYADLDSDGYGDPDHQLAACELPNGYQTDSSDCDDTNPAAYPGAEEGCTDPADLNCDGSTTFVDADGDTVAACLDCNDQEPSVWPGAPEIDGDGVDQNCDGLICQVGPPGAISIWRGEGDLMDEVGGRHGSATGTVSYAGGKVGDAITFGPGDMVSASEVGLPTGNADRSMVLWVWMENAPSNEAIFAGYGNLGGYEESYILGSTGLAPFFSQWGSAVVGPALSLQKWHQIAVTSVGDRSVLYVDGVVAEAGELPIHTVAGTGIYLGTFPGELAAGRAFEGKLDEVMIWDRALRVEEVAELYAIGADGTCP